MVLNTEALASIIEELAPKELAFDWDNTGYNIRLHDDIEKILVCVDVTLDVVKEAASLGVDTIVSHHPVLFRPIKMVDAFSPVGKVVAALVQNNINVYCAHTSFDCAKGGINDVLAQSFGIEEFDVLAVEGVSTIGTIGQLKEKLSAYDFCTKTKEVLGIPHLKCTAYQGAVKKAAFVGGAGGDYIYKAKAKGADALVTGEAKHNEFIEAEALGIMLIAAGHFDTEQCFTHTMAKGLQTKAFALQYNLKVYESKIEKCPYIYV